MLQLKYYEGCNPGMLRLYFQISSVSQITTADSKKKWVQKTLKPPIEKWVYSISKRFVGKDKIMNPLVYVNEEIFGVYFEVTGANMFGGAGSIGYTAIKLHGISGITQIDDYVENKTQETANLLSVPRSAVRIISKKEYDRKTNDDL